MPAIKHDDVLLRLIKDVNDVRSALRRVTSNLPLYDIANENTPAQLTASQNNYAPGNYDILKLSSDAARSITGISGGVKGRYLKIFNVGSYPITLVYESGLSSAANRFKFSNGQKAIIPANSNMLLYYDSAQSRWVGGDMQSSGAVFMQVSNLVSQTIPLGVVTKIDPGTAVTDQYGFYDDTNNQIVIKFDGWYQVSVFAKWDTSVGSDAAMYFYLNTALNSEIFDHFVPSGTVLWQTKMIWYHLFSQGDVIDLRALNNCEAGGYALLEIYTNLTKVS